MINYFVIDTLDELHHRFERLNEKRPVQRDDSDLATQILKTILYIINRDSKEDLDEAYLTLRFKLLGARSKEKNTEQIANLINEIQNRLTQLEK